MPDPKYQGCYAYLDGLWWEILSCHGAWMLRSVATGTRWRTGRRIDSRWISSFPGGMTVPICKAA